MGQSYFVSNTLFTSFRLRWAENVWRTKPIAGGPNEVWFWFLIIRFAVDTTEVEARHGWCVQLRVPDEGIKAACSSSLSSIYGLSFEYCLFLDLENLHGSGTMANARRAPAYLMEVRFTLEFQPDEEKSIVNSILEVLNIQADDCDVNHVVFPTAWTAGFAGRVWIDEIPHHWVPWDTDIEANKQYRLFLADPNIFDVVYTLSVATNSFVSLVNAGVPRDQRDVTTVYVHRLPMVDLMELAADCVDRVRVLEGRLTDLEETVNMMRRHLGI